MITAQTAGDSPFNLQPEFPPRGVPQGIVKDGLSFFWNASDYTSGSMPDSSGNGYSLTGNGTITKNLGAGPNRLDYLAFGNPGYLLGNYTSPSISSLTIISLVRLANATAVNPRIFSWKDGSNLDYQGNCYIPQVGTSNGDNSASLTTSGYVAATAAVKSGWQILIHRFDGAEIRNYINKLNNYTTSAITINRPYNTWTIGGAAGNPTDSNGLFKGDLVYCFGYVNKALNDTELQQNINTIRALAGFVYDTDFKAIEGLNPRWSYTPYDSGATLSSLGPLTFKTTASSNGPSTLLTANTYGGNNSSNRVPWILEAKLNLQAKNASNPKIGLIVNFSNGTNFSICKNLNSTTFEIKGFNGGSQVFSTSSSAQYIRITNSSTSQNYALTASYSTDGINWTDLGFSTSSNVVTIPTLGLYFDGASNAMLGTVDYCKISNLAGTVIYFNDTFTSRFNDAWVWLNKGPTEFGKGIGSSLGGTISSTYSTLNVYGQMFRLPTGLGSNYEAVVRVDNLYGNAAAYPSIGLILYNEANGRIYNLGNESHNITGYYLAMNLWNSITSYNSGTGGAGSSDVNATVYLRLQGNTIYYRYKTTGSWFAGGTFDISFLGGVTHVGVGGFQENTADMVARLVYGFKFDFPNKSITY